MTDSTPTPGGFCCANGSCGCGLADEQIAALTAELAEVKAEREALRRVALAAAADPFPTPETRTAIYHWWAATKQSERDETHSEIPTVMQDSIADSGRETGREA